MRLVPIECVKDDCCLAKTIFDDSGRPLLKDGAKLNSKILRKIKSIGIFSIYIYDEYSNNELVDLISPRIRQKSIKLIKDIFNNQKKNSLKDDFSYYDSILKMSEALLDEILSQKNILVNLVDIKSMDNYTYQHCVNVGVLSLVLGIQLRLTKSELLDLCIGALLHDIGKIFIPKEILNKVEPLTDEEFEIIKTHTEKGYNYVRNKLDMSSTSKIIILQHHEKMDGSGYPDGKKGDKIYKLARIVAIADVYDALTSDRPYRRAMTPNEALEYISGNGGIHFDYTMICAFTSCIIPYPEGTLVKLSSGDIGVVQDIFPNFPLRPNVKLVKSSTESKVGTFVNLMDELDITIQEATYDL